MKLTEAGRKEISFLAVDTAVLIALIQASPSVQSNYRRKVNETSALLDRRVKPGDDGGGVARPDRTNSGFNRTAVGQARQ